MNLNLNFAAEKFGLTPPSNPRLPLPAPRRFMFKFKCRFK